MKKKTSPRHHRRTQTTRSSTGSRQQTFAEHVQELRHRLFIVVGSILFFATAAYFVQQRLVALLLKPAHNQHFIYTSPGGGIGFLFQICTYVGITVSLPILVYQLLRFIEPVIADGERRYIIRMSWLSAGLAIVGVLFGYLIGLPAALHFLSHQFTTKQIQPLLTISEYMSFITTYLIGSALIFQLPLIVVSVNRIRPLKPSHLFNSERYVIAAAFIVSMLMAPTVNIIDQLLLAGPIIVTYQLGVIAVLIKNRSRRPSQVSRLLEADRQVQTARLEVAQTATPLEPTSPFFAHYLQQLHAPPASRSASPRPST